MINAQQRKEYFSAQNTKNVSLHLGSLHKQQALLCLKAMNFTQNTLNINLENQKLILAVSGGVDSIALLLMFAGLRQKLGLTLHIAHLHHGIRNESDKEVEYVQQLSKMLDIPCTIQKISAPYFAKQEHIGLEEAARKLRYKFLEHVRHTENATWILTAHHSDDLMEDSLMRLLRGVAWPALAGMTACDTQRKLLRPLLMLEKRQLVDFVQTLGFSWCEDLSNGDDDFLRNRVRKHIIPLFIKENPSFVESIKNLWHCAQRDNEYFTSAISPVWEQSKIDFDEKNCIQIPLNELNQIPKALRFRVYMQAFHTFSHEKKGQARASTLEQLDLAIQKQQNDKIFSFPGTITAHIQKPWLYFRLN